MKLKTWLVGLLVAALTLPAAGLAETEELSGSVVPGYEVGVTAPFGGTVASVQLREGEWVNEGDVLVTVETTKVFAPEDGTIAAVDLKEGDAVSGTVLTLAPVSKYTVSCSVGSVYGTTDPERTYVHLGEKVYIRCVKDRSHIAVGVITAVSGSDYTVETTGGELYLEEEVNLYRDASYAFDGWIGDGTVARTAAIAVEGEGSLARLHVAPGDEVERGQLLFETVEGALDAYAPAGNDILATAGGVVAAVSLKTGAHLSKGDPVATLYPQSGFQLAAVVPEDMITLIKEGDTLRFYLDWDETSPRWYSGVVESLSYVSTLTAGDTTTFTAYLSFEPDDSVRLGMTAVVELEVP